MSPKEAAARLNEEHGKFSANSRRKSRKKKNEASTIVPKVFWVDPPNFRSLVQKLTGSPRAKSPPFYERGFHAVEPSGNHVQYTSATSFDAMHYPTTSCFGDGHEDYYPELRGLRYDNGFSAEEPSWKLHSPDWPQLSEALSEFEQNSNDSCDKIMK